MRQMQLMWSESFTFSALLVVLASSFGLTMDTALSVGEKMLLKFIAKGWTAFTYTTCFATQPVNSTRKGWTAFTYTKHVLLHRLLTVH